MTTYLIKRVLLMIPTFFGVSLVVWVVLTLAPEPPIEQQAANAEEGEETDDSGSVSTSVKVFRAQYGLDKPAILNFYYAISDKAVRKAVGNASAVEREPSLAERNKGREQLIKWGYYAAPNLARLTRGENGAMRDAALSWLIQAATRITFVPPSGVVDDESAVRNEEVTRENAALRRLAWKTSATPARKAAGAALVDQWLNGAKAEFADGVAVADVRAALDAADQSKFESWGPRAVSGLVALVLDDERREYAAVRQLVKSARRTVPTDADGAALATLHNENIEALAWPESAGRNERRGAVQRVRDWWHGVGHRWDYGGARWLGVMLGETQFARYWSNLFRGDLGESTTHRRPVVELILSRFKYSLSLAVPSLLLAFLISVPLGLISATFHGTVIEKLMALAVFALYSLPSFFVATLVIKFFAEGQPGSSEWIPTGGYESDAAWKMTTWDRLKDIAWHIIAPLFCMTYASFAALSRYAKSGLLNVIRSDYIRTARAKGLSEFVVIVKHAARNGLIPVVTLLGGTLPVVIGGSFVIEVIFSIDGFGKLMVDSVKGNDYTVIVGVTLITASLVMIGILLSDLLYAVVDPRISYS